MLVLLRPEDWSRMTEAVIALTALELLWRSMMLGRRDGDLQKALAGPRTILARHLHQEAMLSLSIS